MNSNIFSIEIFVDRIRLLEGERCYFPATILKLLSYEPTLISTVDTNIQTKLREYLDIIEKSHEIKKICQLDELKDLDGNYVVRKGKSILFEANTMALISEFNSLPLYVLVCDDFYQPNHLVGVVTVKLSETMVSLAKKISKTQHTASEDLMGKFPIVNLMGDGIGMITLKLRLIFIGANLAPHLPREHDIVVKPREKSKNSVEKCVGLCQDDTARLALENLVSVRTVGCQADKNRTVRLQVAQDTILSTNNNLAQAGLSIDPTDPVLENIPPMIYCSHYGRVSSDSESEEIVRKSPIKSVETPGNPGPVLQASARKSPANLPILTALFNELKCWKSQDDGLETNGAPQLLPVVRNVRSNRAKSVDMNQPIKIQLQPDVSQSEFVRRLSQPKVRPASPTGLVPRNKGWLRTEREYAGPARSALDYKLTKTQVRRIELRNPRLFSKIVKQKASLVTDASGEFSSAADTPIVRSNRRNPLVPPLFTAGTSLSAPSFTMSDSSGTDTPRARRGGAGDRRPPQSPGKDAQQYHQANNYNSNNNNSSSHCRRYAPDAAITRLSYDTDDTVNEADQFLNLNPVQSNRSPHMSTRSHIVARDSDTSGQYEVAYRGYSPADRDDDLEIDGEDIENDRKDEVHYRPEEYYSDEFNQSGSTDNARSRSQSRKQSNVSQISQTSEWRTDYSIASSGSQNNQARSESPDIQTQRSPPRTPVKKRRSLLSNGIIPGGRFLDGTGSGSLKTVGSFRPSLNGSLAISILDSSGKLENSLQSIEDRDYSPSMLRPGSAGADVTSFTKVTKYERSLVPGPVSSNMHGTHLITSTVGSLRTDDSQILTSESYY